MADARDIIVDALRELGVLAATETPTADDAAFALRAMNRLFDGWAAERLTIYQLGQSPFAIANGTREYAVAAGDDIDREWPVYPQKVTLIDSSVSSTREVPLWHLTDAAWMSVPDKEQSGTPTCWWVDHQWPVGYIYLWPVPNSDTLSGVLYAPQAVSEVTSLNQVFSLPPGWRRAIIKNLAMELAPSYDRPLSPELAMAAVESKATIKRANKRLVDMRLDPGVLVGGRAYSINEG